MPAMTIMPAEEAKKYVLENAGATLPIRDAVDKSIAEQVRTGKIVVSPDVVVPAAQFKHRRAPLDCYKKALLLTSAR